MTHHTFRNKWNVKTVSSKVQVPPLLRQRHNEDLVLFHKSLFGPRSILSLRPCFGRSIGWKTYALLAAIFLFHSCFFTHSINQGWENLFNGRL